MKQKVLFTLLFAVIGFIALQIPFTKLMGSNVSFTLFDFFGPIAGAFLGPVLGVISVLAVQLVNFVVIKGVPLEAGPLIRLFPMLFAVWYFGTVYSSSEPSESRSPQSSSRQARTIQSRLILAVPLLAIIVFVAHPIGRTVWYYSLFWLIPLLAYLKRDRLLIRSLGATFTAHAVGGAAWIWAFNLPATVWQSLIPIVIQERIVFALGIAASYIIMREALKFLISKHLLPTLQSPALRVGK